MTTTDKAALLERAANALRESAERADADGQVGTADRDLDASLACAAWADELRAEPPWLDAPDGPGGWEGNKPGYVAHDLVVTSVFDRLYVRSAEKPDDDDLPLLSWCSTRAGWRYRRRAPVIVPPREVTP